MNYLQLLLLKLGEEAGEIITEVLDVEAALKSGEVDAPQLYLKFCSEITDFYAIVAMLNDNFAIGYNGCNPSLDVIDMVAATSLEDFPALLTRYAMDLQKIAAKTMQFGLYETNPKMEITNCGRLLVSLSDFIHVCNVYINKRQIDYRQKVSEMQAKIDKVNKYADYSISLLCLSSQPVPEVLYKPHV